MLIRAADLDDLDELTQLFDAYRQFYRQTSDAPLARAFIAARMHRHESVILVAENEDLALLGFCQMYPSFCSVEAIPIYVLYDLYIAFERRRHGVGRALMLAAEARARENGMGRIDLATARSNAAAQALYESLGWRRDTQFYIYSKTL